MPTAETEFQYEFTVFTTTRNRAHTLDRPFASLQAQTFRDFEWLVIDNGSTDGTSEVVERFRADAAFPIRYYWQEDAGKHGSMNRGAQLAKGYLFAILDSDDGLIPTTLERLKHQWESIPPNERHRFVGVTGLCNDETGRLVGTPFPLDPTDSDPREIRFRHKVIGEKWGCQRTTVLREHPFDVVPGYSGLIPEGIVWSAIGRQYKTRYFNEALRIYWQDQQVSLSRPTRLAEDAYGRMLENESSIANDMEFFVDAPRDFLMAAANYVRWALHASRGFRGQWSALSRSKARLLWLAGLPGGVALYWLDRSGITRYLRRARYLLANLRGRRSPEDQETPRP